MRKRGIRGLLLLVVLLSAVRLAWTGSVGEEAPRAAGGVMDLGGWHAQADGSVSLAGEWLLVPGEWIDPDRAEDPAALPASARAIRVPGGWDGSLEEGRSTPFGYGTYYLKVLLPADGGDGTYGVRVTNIRSAHALYVNGERVGGAGVPGETRGTTEPANMPYVAEIGDTGRELVIVLHVANFHYAWQGGVFDDVTFGPLAGLYREHERQGAYDAVIGCGFAAAGALLLLMFFARMRTPDAGWFAVLLLLVALYWLTHGNKLLFEALPGIAYIWQTRLQLLVTISAAGIFMLFVRALYPDVMLPAMVRAVLAVLGALALCIAAVPPQWSVHLEPVVILVGMAAAAGALAAMAIGTMREEEGQLYPLTGITAVVHFAVFQGLFFLGIRERDGLPPIELAIFLVCVVLLWISRFQRTLKRVEKLSGELAIAGRLKDEFMMNASQELRTPLQSMVSLAELMLEEGRAEEKDAHRLRLMLASGRKLSHLLDEMLDLTKLIEGSAALRMRAVDVRHMAEAVLELVGHLGDGREERPVLENRVAAGLPLVRADANRLLQILLNLVHEAMQASGVREVAITAGPGSDARYLVIEVTRRGGDAPASERLETAVSRKLVELHGGRLDLVTEPDGRTAARFTLPVETSAALPDEWSLSAPNRAKPPKGPQAERQARRKKAMGPPESGEQPDRALPGIDGADGGRCDGTRADGIQVRPPKVRRDVVREAASGAVVGPGMAADEAVSDGRPAVLLADDDPVVLQVMAELLDREGWPSRWQAVARRRWPNWSAGPTGSWSSRTRCCPCCRGSSCAG